MSSRTYAHILLILLLHGWTGGAAANRLPANWPADATLPEEARILAATVNEWTQSVTFELPAREDEALEDVTETLEDHGWTTEYAERVGNRRSVRLRSVDGRTITILARATLAGSTAVLFTIYQPA